MPCSTATQKLYGELAASLVRAATQRCEPHEPRTRVGAKVDGSGGISAFEGACLMLKELGLATNEWTREYRLVIDGDHVAHVVSNRAQTGRAKLPPIDDVLDTRVSLFAGQLSYVSLKRLPFIPEQDVWAVMSALAASGYAKQINGAFLWTDKIASAMQISGWSNENGLSREELV